MVVGTLYCIDFDQVEQSDIFEDAEKLDGLVRNVIKTSGLKMVGEPLVHHFHAQGLTYVTLLSLSHLAIHTWPEHRFISIDFFTCGDPLLAREACEILRHSIACHQTTVRLVHRGTHDE